MCLTCYNKTMYGMARNGERYACNFDRVNSILRIFVFSFFRKSKIENGAKKALEESGINAANYTDYFRFIKGLGFIDALDASKDALTQPMQSICFAFATLDLMRLRCQMHGQTSNLEVVQQSLDYLAEALTFQISVSSNPEYSERNVNILLDAITKDARNFIKDSVQ